MAQKSGAFEVKTNEGSAVKAKDHSEKDQKPDKTESAKKEDPQKDNEKEKGEEKKVYQKEYIFSIQGPSLFANLNLLQPNPTGSVGLFSSIGNSTNLFNNSNVTPNLFGQSSIFSNSSSGLFQVKAGQSIFDNTNVKQVPNGGLFSQAFQGQNSDESDEGGDEGEGKDDQKSQEEEQKEIIMKYEYQKQTTPIVKFSLVKFRKNTNDVLEKGSIALEKFNESDKYLLLYRNSIQNVLYQGYIVKGITQVQGLGQRKENLMIKTISSEGEQNDQEKKQKIRVDSIKLMFCEASQAVQFHDEIDKILANKKE